MLLLLVLVGKLRILLLISKQGHECCACACG
jgi:hypothetical protein